jgi:hypothetical protein
MKRKTIILSAIIPALLILLSIAVIKMTYGQNYLFRQSYDAKDWKGIYESISFQSPAIEERPYVGSDKAPLTIIFALDFQSGLAKTFYFEKMEWLKNTYVNNTARLYHKYIITRDDWQGRKGGFIKALASYCHDKQSLNDTLDFNKALFDAKVEGIEGLYALAENFSLDKAAFNACMNSTPKALTEDMVETEKFLLQSPSLIVGVNGQDNDVIYGNPSYETITKRIRLKQIKVGI